MPDTMETPKFKPDFRSLEFKMQRRQPIKTDMSQFRTTGEEDFGDDVMKEYKETMKKRKSWFGRLMNPREPKKPAPFRGGYTR